MGKIKNPKADVHSPPTTAVCEDGAPPVISDSTHELDLLRMLTELAQPSDSRSYTRARAMLSNLTDNKSLHMAPEANVMPLIRQLDERQALKHIVSVRGRRDTNTNYTFSDSFESKLLESVFGIAARKNHLIDRLALYAYICLMMIHVSMVLLLYVHIWNFITSLPLHAFFVYVVLHDYGGIRSARIMFVYVGMQIVLLHAGNNRLVCEAVVCTMACLMRHHPLTKPSLALQTSKSHVGVADALRQLEVLNRKTMR